MFKKILGSASALVVAISLLTAAAPANATGVQQYTFPIGEEILVQKVLPNNSVFVWGDAAVDDTDFRQLIGYVISPQGVVGSRIVFDTFNAKDYLDFWHSSVFQKKNGTLVFGWSIYSAANRRSSMKLSTTRDGVNWTPQVKPVADFIPAVGQCLADGQGQSPQCGYSIPTIAEDGKGRLGVGFSIHASSDADLVSPVALVTSTNLVYWSKPVLYKQPVSKAGYSFVNALVGLPAGGFGATWGGYGFDGSTYGSGIWSTGAKKFSSVSNLPISSNGWIISDIIKLDANRYLQFTTKDFANPSTTRFAYTILNVKTKTWSPLKVLNTAIGQDWLGNLAFATDSLGDIYATTLVRNWNPDLTTPNNSKLVSIKIPAGQAPLEPEVISNSSISESAFAISFDSNNNRVFYMRDWQNQIFEKDLTADGLTDPTNTFVSFNQVFDGQLDSSGNISSIYDDSDGIYHWQRFMPDREPVAKTTPAISGKAKLKSSLTVSALGFYSNSTLSTNLYQWYSCDSATTTALFNAIPDNCTALPGATARSYKVDSADLGQYLAVTVTSTNATGTTQVLSKTTSKVK